MPERERVKPKRRSITRMETMGLLIIAVLILIFTVVRYWHHIGWSAR